MTDTSRELDFLDWRGSHDFNGSRVSHYHMRYLGMSPVNHVRIKDSYFGLRLLSRFFGISHLWLRIIMTVKKRESWRMVKAPFSPMTRAISFVLRCS